MNFRDYVDASYDKDFKKIMESHPLTWFPWVGHFYRKARLKVLIVAESHYANDNDPQKLKEALENCADDVNFTREVMFESGIDYWYGNSMLEGLERALLRTSNLGDRAKQLWGNLAFYNFIQRPMQYNHEMKERPTNDEFYRSWNVFLQVVKLLRPTRVIFVGNTAANFFDAAMAAQGVSYESMKWGSYTNRSYPKEGALTIENNRIQICCIRHSSNHFSWTAWHEYLLSQMPDVMQFVHEITFGNETAIVADEPTGTKDDISVIAEGLPTWLQHKPIIATNYQRVNSENGLIDYDDVKFLSLGRAQYNSDETALKLFRHSGNRWSRQSEEVPIQRLSFLMELLLATIYRVQHPEDKSYRSNLGEEVVVTDDMDFIKEQLRKWREPLVKSLKDVYDLLCRIDIDDIGRE